MHKMIVETTNLETMREKSNVNKNNNNNYKKVLDINNKLMNKKSLLVARAFKNLPLNYIKY